MVTAVKIDMKRELGDLYAAPRHPELVDVPPLRYLMIDGAAAEGATGPADDPGFRAAVGELYSLSYTLKFEMKERGEDYVVMPLEGLFWTHGSDEFRPGGPAPTRWTLMILQPPHVTPLQVADAGARLLERGKLERPPRARLETLREGRAAHVLHLGPYAQEAPTIERLHAFIDELGLTRRGKHHEIYLSDPNRTAPERLKTVIRQPVSPRETVDEP